MIKSVGRAFYKLAAWNEGNKEWLHIGWCPDGGQVYLGLTYYSLTADTTFGHTVYCFLPRHELTCNLGSSLLIISNRDQVFEKSRNLLKGRVGNASCWYSVEWRTGGVWCWQIGQTRIVGITYGLLRIAYGLWRITYMYVCMYDRCHVAVSYMMMNMIQMHCSYDSQYAIIAMMIRLSNFLNLMGESVVQTNWDILQSCAWRPFGKSVGKEELPKAVDCL